MFGMSTRWSLLQRFGTFLSILAISVPAQAQSAANISIGPTGSLTISVPTPPGFVD